jgi:hypothetical protein
MDCAMSFSPWGEGAPPGAERQNWGADEGAFGRHRHHSPLTPTLCPRGEGVDHMRECHT